MTSFFDRFKKTPSPAAAPAPPAPPASKLIADLSHHSGFTRQAAVEQAATSSDPALLPLLIERLNDWVPNVRDAARVTVLATLSNVPASAVIGMLPAVLRLRLKGRSQHEQWLVQFEAELLRHVSPDALLAAVQGSDIKVGRACFDLLHRHALFEQPALIDLALSSRVDIVLAGNAANMIHHLPPALQAARYAKAANSRFGRVRTLGIRGLLQPPTSDSKRELAASCLLDRQSWVRQTAIAFCIADQVDVKSYYRTQLADPTLGATRRCIVLTALAGFRDKDDLTLARQFAQHPQPAVRQAALYAWLKLAEESKDEIALQAFSDDADSIRKIALALVRRRGAYIAFDTLQADLLARQEWTVLLEFARFGQWTLLEAVARISLATASSDHALTATLRRELVAWTQCRSFTRPTPAQLHFLQAQQTQEIFDALVGGTPSFNTIVQREISLVVK